MKLQDKVALSTGTGPNIGGGIATGLADEGAKVGCVDAGALAHYWRWDPDV